jgi:hypothetical protein
VALPQRRSVMDKIKELKAEDSKKLLLIDEIEIIELEDRLELEGRCNGCTGQSQ